MIYEFIYGQNWKIWPSPLSLFYHSAGPLTLVPFTEGIHKLGNRIDIGIDTQIHITIPHFP